MALLRFVLAQMQSQNCGETQNHWVGGWRVQGGPQPFPKSMPPSWAWSAYYSVLPCPVSSHSYLPLLSSLPCLLSWFPLLLPLEQRYSTNCAQAYLPAHLPYQLQQHAWQQVCNSHFPVIVWISKRQGEGSGCGLVYWHGFEMLLNHISTKIQSIYIYSLSQVITSFHFVVSLLDCLPCYLSIVKQVTVQY